MLTACCNIFLCFFSNRDHSVAEFSSVVYKTLIFELGNMLLLKFDWLDIKAQGPSECRFLAIWWLFE